MLVMPPVPHYDRLLRLLEETTQQRVELWGWRGSGKRAFLAELMRREPERVQILVEAALRRPERLDREMAAGAGRGARWVLVEHPAAGEDLEKVRVRLEPDQTLVVAVQRRVGGGRRPPPAEVLPPESLLLEPGEVAELWRRLRGEAPSGELLERLVEQTEGWLRPLEILARSADFGEGSSPLDCLPLARFLELEVLAPLSAGERRALRALAEGSDGTGWARALPTLASEWGLVRATPGGMRLPRLLALHLRRGADAPSTVVRLAGVAEGAPGPAVSSGVVTADVVEVHLLGTPILRRRCADGTAVDLEWSLRRALLLLAYLASRPERQALRAELVEAVWPEADAETVRKNFHPTISLLRRCLAGPSRSDPPALVYSAGSYRLSPLLAWEVDVERFRDLVELGRGAASDVRRAELWSAARELYRGHYLPGHDLAWVVALREELLRLFLDLLRDLGAVLLRLGRLREAEDALRTALVEDPLQEEVYVSIMRIYADRGRRDLVRRQYERLCQVLLQELGLEPLPTTAAEYQRLMT